MTSLGKIYSDKEIRGGHAVQETEEFLRLPSAELSEVLAILEKL
ncbi:TPA: hypothetical protein ACN7DQ_005119 [Klebsiella pneumoniae]